LANIKSAAKRARQAIVRRNSNQQAKKAIRSLEKKVRAAISAKDKESAASLLKNYTGEVAKATLKGLFHKNTSARKVSRLTQFMNKSLG